MYLMQRASSYNLDFKVIRVDRRAEITILVERIDLIPFKRGPIKYIGLADRG